MPPSPAHHTAGLHPRKLDLHVHTPASKDYEVKSDTPAVIIAAAKAKGLDGIAITDHNSGGLVDELKEEGGKHGIVVFPGAEITCMGGPEGIHVIGLFDPSCSRAHVEGLLSALGLKPEEFGDIKAIVKKDVAEVIEVIHERGGLAVLAHANSTRGVLCDMKGEQRTHVVRCPHLSAAEGTDFQNEAKKAKESRVVDLLSGKDPVYQRELAVYQASDNPSPRVDGAHSKDGIGSRCAYFKLDRIDLDGLRQCFSDPLVRIRQDFEYAVRQYPCIKEVAVTGGFLDDVRIPLHQGLNSILGAKGTGKSLLIEFLRFALDQPATNDEVVRDHEAKLQARLEDFGAVEILLSDETGKGFRIKRLFNPAEDNPYIDTQHPDLSQTFPVLFLSQNEIIKIAEAEDEQLQFLDRFFDFRAFRNQIADVERRLQALDTEFADCARSTIEKRDLEKRLAVAREDLKKLDAELKNPVFDAFAALELKDRAFREQAAAVKASLEKMQRAGKDIAALSPSELPEKLREDPALRRVHDRAKQAHADVRRELAAATEGIEKQLKGIADEHARWLPDLEAGKREYEEAVRRTGGDYKALAAKRGRVSKDIETLEGRLRRASEKAMALKEAAESRQRLLGELKTAYEAYTTERKTRCERIEAGSGGQLRIRIREASNVDEFKRRLTELKRGSYLRDSEIDRLCTKLEPGEFMRAIIRFSLSGNVSHLDVIVRAAELDLARVRSLAEFLAAEYPYETLLALEYKALPQDRPEIKYNVGGGSYELLQKLSVGQKCTALLIIALSEGTMPVVIDQPEDSLDIRSIWDDICLKVRRGKEQRQFIFTTHNSSVAVAGDTDKFTILEATSTRGRVVASGSMDHPPISDEAMKYLEGGSSTYRAKFKKYRGDKVV